MINQKGYMLILSIVISLLIAALGWFVVARTISDNTLEGNLEKVDQFITVEKALEIASQNNFLANDLVAQEGGFYPGKSGTIRVIKISSCQENKAMYLDYKTGEILNFKQELICAARFKE